MFTNISLCLSDSAFHEEGRRRMSYDGIFDPSCSKRARIQLFVMLIEVSQ